MPLSTSVVQAAFRSMRSTLTGATVNVRIKGKVYSGVRSFLTLSDDPANAVEFQDAEGAVRLDLSEFKKPYPKADDPIDVKEPDSTNYKLRRIIAPRYDQAGGTVLLTYGERDG